ncbi:agmatinase precursor [Cordyceps fumosorosea ARSEF 2679]|uniref:Agmatinase n=1 Tax=Cordyceps fumosorosea (strain ARSEF 2679) TaxID=1081104 RepID=A0A167LCZ6_CORFA|nr:agmatinase precursor [Cordyceps fumosorosea ARSEF 2679]OAA52943.1 agmatinase precursor [Cordyceps fumosorosea ARSEF 2679]
MCFFCLGTLVLEASELKTLAVSSPPQVLRVQFAPDTEKLLRDCKLNPAEFFRSVQAAKVALPTGQGWEAAIATKKHNADSRDVLRVLHRFECYNIYRHVVEAGLHTGEHWIRESRLELVKTLCQKMALRSLFARVLALAALVLWLVDASWAVKTETTAELEEKWGSDWAISGISTFNHLPHSKCLVNQSLAFDIAVVGLPFDALTTYRSGAREGPKAIRWASGRHLSTRSFHTKLGFNPYESWASVLDCGDVPIIPNDPVLAMEQMEDGLANLLSHPTTTDRWSHPRLVLLGGDHSVVLPMLRALKTVRGEPVALLHFDAHMDTLAPDAYPRKAWKSKASEVHHGTVFWHAVQEGLLIPRRLVHAGIHGRVTGAADLGSDDGMGFLRISVEEMDDVGADAIADRIYEVIGPDVPVYVSIDIDVLDPAFAPGTGAPETGGWTSRELIRIMTVLGRLDVVGVDVVEVTPAYDSAGGDTAFAAANLAYEAISMMVMHEEEKAPKEKARENVRTEL